MAKLTAILPAYNNELCISSIILSSKKYVDKVIVVDNGSTDNTAKIAELAGAQLIRHHYNKGKGTALKTGFKAAQESEIIITLDSDGQHNPKEIPKLITPIINGEADIVNGSRYIIRNKKNTPFYIHIGKLILDKITNLNSRIDITDSQSGFRAFARYTIPAFRFSRIDFGIESEMLMDAANAGLRIKEVEISAGDNVDNSTETRVDHSFEVLKRFINDLQFQRYLFYFALPGVLITLVGIVLGFIFFGDYLARSSLMVPSISYSLAPTIFAMMMTLVGGFLALTGIILNSIEKSNYNSQNRVKAAEHIDFNNQHTN